MGIMDSIKGLFGGNKQKIKDGIDKGADVIGDKAGSHADKVAKGRRPGKGRRRQAPGVNRLRVLSIG